VQESEGNCEKEERDMKDREKGMDKERERGGR
jgi:hypothetical protein